MFWFFNGYFQSFKWNNSDGKAFVAIKSFDVCCSVFKNLVMKCVGIILFIFVQAILSYAK